MAVYTSIDMLEDCRAGRARGWECLVARFVPALEWIAGHYRRDLAAQELFFIRFLAALRDDPESPVNRLRAATDREFLFHAAEFLLDWAGILRPGGARSGAREILDGALGGFTRLERQIVWVRVLGYRPAEIAELLPAGEERIREVLQRAADALGGNAAIVSEEPGRMALIGEVRSDPPDEPVPLRQLFQVLDGRLDWRRRDEIEDRLVASWYELDRFCRARETAMALRKVRPLPASRTAEYLRVLRSDRDGASGGPPGRLRRLRLLPFFR